MDTIVKEHESIEANHVIYEQGSLSEDDMITEVIDDEINEYEKLEAETQKKATKRDREEDEEGEWTVVQNKEKKYKGEKVEMYVTCNEIMPKQFALAKILKTHNITNIEKVRYINPYRIRLDISCESSAEKLENCQELISKGWRFQRAMEVNLSYGVIRDIDIEMTEDDILKSITCPEPSVLISVSRLTRRNSEGDGWKPSESVRLTFKGSFRPASISVEGLRIRVDPYVFPVSQCSRCWKLGHPTKRCPTAKVVCPKCSDNHANCDTTNFKCVNCGGQHMALVRSCPVYLREKQLRELMSEFNCTYRRALMMYVPISKPEQNAISEHKVEILAPTPAGVVPDTPRQGLSYADVLTQATTRKNISKIKEVPQPPNKQKRHKNPDYFEWGVPSSDDAACIREDTQKEESKEREVKFSELLSRLREILFLKSDTIPAKVQSVIKCCLEWIILVVVENISDWPTLKTILDFFVS